METVQRCRQTNVGGEPTVVRGPTVGAESLDRVPRQCRRLETCELRHEKHHRLWAQCLAWQVEFTQRMCGHCVQQSVYIGHRNRVRRPILEVLIPQRQPFQTHGHAGESLEVGLIELRQGQVDECRRAAHERIVVLALFALDARHVWVRAHRLERALASDAETPQTRERRQPVATPQTMRLAQHELERQERRRKVLDRETELPGQVRHSCVKRSRSQATNSRR